MDEVPVLRPQLPMFDAIAPYLREIDASRIYSNHGPLVVAFEQRMAAHLGLAHGEFCSASSGTAAIVGAVLAVAGRAHAEKPYAFIPDFTFVGTAVAVEQCGYRPYVVDCDAKTWAITPEIVSAAPEFARCGLVVVVAPFGRPIDQRPWSEFSKRFGIPVVIDGAASFDLVARNPAPFLGEIPVAFSFHATKAFGIGEGGGIATRDAGLTLRIARALNFGYLNKRDSEDASINGKLSEYHAAVGLAALDEWGMKKAILYQVADDYLACARSHSVDGQLHVAPGVSCGYVIYEANTLGESEAIVARLHTEKIGSRLWYGSGISANAYFTGVSTARIMVSRDLALRLIGLPLAPDLDSSAIRRVLTSITKAVPVQQST